MLRAGHPTDRLLHQRAAYVVRPTNEHGPTALHPELDPGALDVVDRTVQQNARHRVHGPVLLAGGAGTGDTGQVDRRAVMDEGEGHELGEAAGGVLDAP